MFGYCSLQATVRPSWSTTLWTWPSDAAAAGSSGNSAKRLAQSGPSSATMRRRTKGLLIGGALLCSWASSAAYSAGRASGMVAISCATFINGPFRPPSASLQLDGVGAVERAAHQAGAGHARRLHAHRAADLGVAAKARAEAALALDLACGCGLIGHVGSGMVASSWSISPSSSAQPLGPEAGVRGVEPERGQQLLVAQGAAGAQELEIARLEAVRRLLVDRVERADEAIAKGVGIDVEGHVDEVRDIAPVEAIVLAEMEGRPQALGLDLHPDPA